MTVTHSGTVRVIQNGNDTAKHAKLPLVVYVLALGTFLMLTTEFVVAGILLEIADDLQVSSAQVGNLITVFALGMIIGAPVMALATLKLSKRLTLVAALAVFVIGHVIVAISSNFIVLEIARFITALATGAFWAVAAVVATRAAGPLAGARAMGIVSAGGSLATVLGVPIGAFIAQAAGWRGTFWTLAIIGTVVAVVIARLVGPDSRDSATVSVRRELAGLASVRLWMVLLAGALTTGGVLSTYSFIAPLLTEQAGIPSAFVPLVLTGFGVGSFVGTILGGRLGDAHPGLVTFVAPAASSVLLVLLGITVGAPWVVTILVVLLGLVGLSANGVLIHLAVRHSGGTGTLGSALQVSAFNVGTAAGTAVAGTVLATAAGISAVPFISAVIVGFAVAPVAILAVLRRKETAHI